MVTLVICCCYLLPFFEQLLSDTFYFQKFKWSPYATGLRSQETSVILNGMISGFTSGSKLPGIGLLIMLLLPLRFFIGNKGEAKYLKIADWAACIGVLYLIPISNLAPWEHRPLAYFSVIQFPWRLYEFVIFFFTIAGGYYLYLICKTRNAKILLFTLIMILTSVVIIIDSLSYKDTKLRDHLADKELNEQTHYLFSGMEYFPSRMPYPDPFILNRRDSVFYNKQDETFISGFVRNRNITEFNVNISFPDSLELPLIYYKGYAATIDAKSISVEESNHGLVQIPVDRSGSVKVYYKGTIVQKVSWYITIVSIFVLCVHIFVQKKRKQS